MLNREQILKAAIPREEVKFPELGGSFFVRGLSGKESEEVEARGENTTGLRAWIMQHCALDADGNPLFTEADRPALEQLAGSVTNKILAVVTRLSGMDKEEVKALEKN